MISTGYKRLSCGPLLIYAKDEKRNQAYMEIRVNFGGEVKKFRMNDEVINIPDGLAHLLEHTIIEDSMYGNIMTYASNNYINYNGCTSPNKTIFYFDVACDFYKHLEELIRYLNTKVFKEENIENIKKPVLVEVKRAKDTPYRKFHEKVMEQTKGGNGFKSNIGTIESVSGITYDLLSKVYDAFYQPSNQIIYITGNFDLDKTVDLIERLYKEFNKPKIDYEVLDVPYTLHYEKTMVHHIDSLLDEMAGVDFKVDISKFTPAEKVKLTFYLHYFLLRTFDDVSDIYKIVKEEELSTYSFRLNFSTISKDILNISVEIPTGKADRIFELIMDGINNKKFYPEFFDLWKKDTLMRVLVRESNIDSLGYAFYDNITEFDYYEKDTVEDVDNYTLDDLIECINKLDFSNFMYYKQTKE